MLDIFIVILLATIGLVIWSAIVVACTLRIDGGGHICERCGSSTCTNDDECEWCKEFEI